MTWLRDLGRDLQLAGRTLRRRPGFTALAVTILALGLGGATAMFSIVDALLLRPLPFPEAARLVRIHRTMPGDSADAVDRLHSPGGYFAYRAQRDVFEGVAAVNMGGQRLELDPGQPLETILGAHVSPEYFPVFRVQPRLGRLFAAGEYQPGHDRVVLLSSQLWQTRFGADPGIVGRKLRADGEVLTVIGVMPPELHDPLRYWSRGLFWRPLAFPPGAENNHQAHWLRLLARLAPGVAMTGAEAAVKTVAARIDADHQTRSSARLVTPQETGALDVGGTRVLWLSMGLAVLVLLLAGINLAGVQLARLATRGHDLAVRAALGAGRGRLARQLVTESLVLGLLGGAAGVLVGHWCTQLLASRITIGWRWVYVGVPAQLDGRVLAVALLLALVIAALMGAAPAWLSARDAVSRTLRGGGRGTAGGAATWPRLRQALVVSEMALALTLLAAGGLFLRGLHRFVDRDLGWKADGLLTAELDLPGAAYRGERSTAFQDQLQQRLAALPGVEAVAFSGALPVWENGWRARPLWVQGTPRPRLAEAPEAFGNAVSADYFTTVGLPLREGRLFTAADRTSAPVAVINEAMARALWPGASAIGKQIADPRADPARPEQWMTVVGVVADARFAATLTAPATRYQAYQPLRGGGSVQVVLRTRGGAPAALAPELRRTVAAMASDVSVNEVHDVRALVDRTMGNTTLLAWTLFAFAGLGVVLSALGVYGLFSAYVIQRTREIGVRMALGAAAGEVLRLVLGKGMRLALIGAVLGVAGAAAVVRVLASVAAELPPHEPIAVVALAAVLVAVALFACWLPARRAAAVEPMVALRHD